MTTSEQDFKMQEEAHKEARIDDIIDGLSQAAINIESIETARIKEQVEFFKDKGHSEYLEFTIRYGVIEKLIDDMMLNKNESQAESICDLIINDMISKGYKKDEELEKFFGESDE